MSFAISEVDYRSPVCRIQRTFDKSVTQISRSTLTRSHPSSNDTTSTKKDHITFGHLERLPYSNCSLHLGQSSLVENNFIIRDPSFFPSSKIRTSSRLVMIDRNKYDIKMSMGDFSSAFHFSRNGWRVGGKIRDLLICRRAQSELFCIILRSYARIFTWDSRKTTSDFDWNWNLANKTIDELLTRGKTPFYHQESYILKSSMSKWI